jgi:hypothetical protein
MKSNKSKLHNKDRISICYETTTAQKRSRLSIVETPMSRRYLMILQRWIPFGIRYFQDWPKRPDCGHFFGGVYFYGGETIRPMFTLAAAISSPEYDPKVTGYSRDALVRFAVKALRYACFTHDTGPEDCVRPEKGLGAAGLCGTKWGERGKGFFPESQCGVNLSMLTASALILRPWLDRDTWMMVAGICADYLERFAGMPPKSGIYLDTQAEENAWTALGLTSARMFLGRHAAAYKWEEAARRWMFCAATVPDDARDHRQFDKHKSVRELCGMNFTLLPDFMAENHGMVHPGYTAAAITLAGSTVNLYRLFGKREPEHLHWHRRDIYDNLKRMSDPHGIIHPAQGMDWPYLTPSGLCPVHGFARLYLKDPDAAHYENAALELTEKIISGNRGRMYHPDIIRHCRNVQDHMILCEVFVCSLAGIYLAHRLCAGEPAPETTAPAILAGKYAGVKTYPHSGFVFHRHAKGQTSFSWRNEIMALPLTREGLLTVAPACGSVLGKIKVKEFAASRRLQLLHVNDRKTGFAAVMRAILHDDSIRQDVMLASLPDGRLVCREVFRALKTCTIEKLEQGYLEIINETFPELKNNCVGRRKFYSPRGEHTFPSMVKPNPRDDKVVTFIRPGWLNLDDRMGIIIASDTHRSLYHNRHYFKPYHAVSDDVFLNLQEKRRRYRADNIIADIVFMLCPGQSHAKTPRQELRLARPYSPGTWGILADHILVLGNFDARNGCHAFQFTRPRLIPVFAGMARLQAERVIYETDLPQGQGHFLEALTVVETNESVTIAALPNGQMYITNHAPRTALISIQRRSICKTVSVKSGQTVSENIDFT